MDKLPMILAVFSCFLLFASGASAQDISSGVAVSVPIEGGNVQDGDLVCQTEAGFVLCANEYDPTIFGVVSSRPAISLSSSASANLQPVIQSGKMYMWVSTRNGVIRKGDYITSSPVAGVGQKAVRSGYVVGVAQQDYAVQDTDEAGKILVQVGPRPAIMTQKASANLIELIKQGIDASYLSPIMALRYLLAAAMTVGSVIVGFWFFGRVASNGVIAMGRNPLAGKNIQMSVILNVILTIAIMGVGVFISYLLLVL